jgi:excisionase family DNA binding protein
MFLSVPEAAKRLGVSSPTVRRLLLEGQLGGVIYKAGSRYQYKVDGASLTKLLRRGSAAEESFDLRSLLRAQTKGKEQTGGRRWVK